MSYGKISKKQEVDFKLYQISDIRTWIPSGCPRDL